MRNFQTSYNASDLASNQVIRIDAIYGKDIPHEQFISDTPEDTLGPGMVGCFLSHLKTYKTFGESDKPYALIFEDDAKVDPAIFEGTIQNLHSLIPANWDMILLGYYDHDPSHMYEDLGTCRKAFHFWGLHGYLVNKKSAQKLYSNMLPPFSNQIDHVMSRLSREGDLNIYAVKKQAVWQNAKYTDVQIR
jgi:GR25 family glycosyltransferase involved in LPS biosynthesis